MAQSLGVFGQPNTVSRALVEVKVTLTEKRTQTSLYPSTLRNRKETTEPGIRSPAKSTINATHVVVRSRRPRTRPFHDFESIEGIGPQSAFQTQHFVSEHTRRHTPKHTSLREETRAANGGPYNSESRISLTEPRIPLDRATSSGHSIEPDHLNSGLRCRGSAT